MILRAIRFYQRWISPFSPPHCRFIPTCSAYAVEAIETHGTLRGGRMALGRVCRCHPFHNTSGYDPVPPAAGAQATAGGNDSGEHQSQSGNPCLVNHPLDQAES